MFYGDNFLIFYEYFSKFFVIINNIGKFNADIYFRFFLNIFSNWNFLKTKFHIKWFYNGFISFLFIQLAKEREISWKFEK